MKEPDLSFPSLRGRARAATIGAGGVGVLLAASAIAAWQRSELLATIDGGGAVTIWEGDQADTLVRVAALGDLVAFVVGGALFICWFVRAYANVPSLGGRQKHHTRWAIWCWFVPLLWLVRPFAITEEIAAQLPGVRSILVRGWWWLFLIHVGASRAVSLQSPEGRSLGWLATSDRAAAIVAMVGLVAAILWIIVIRLVTVGQEARDAIRQADAEARGIAREGGAEQAAVS